MENKINIAELLKDCPKGMELDCTIWDNVTLVHVDNEDIPFPITLSRKTDDSESFLVTTKYGQYYSDSKCVIFPKGKTTWEGFVPPCKFKKESEDEKIRKAIYNALKYLEGELSWDFLDDVDILDAYAWLEKQSKPNPYSGVSFEYNGHTWGMCARDNGVEIGMDGNLKAFISSDKSFIYHVNSLPTLTPKSAHEAINEEKVDNQNCVKPADKVEPRFHEGDLVACEELNTAKILSINVDKYEVEFIDGHKGFPHIDYIDRNFHLWTIQDAKDGDVLCTYECNEPKIVFILKGTPKKHYALSYHCYYNIMYPHFASDSEKGCLAPNDEDVKPATKEQRDLLFQKMKETGYKWNPETKTLEKLIKPKFKVGDRIKHKDSDIYCTLGEYSEGISAYRTNIGLSLTHKDLEQLKLVPNKFDITTLKPFESKVLVRAADNQFWRPAIWGVKHWDWDFCCVLGGEMWEQCIPYEGNEHLLGTTDNCDEYYKTWE